MESGSGEVRSSVDAPPTPRRRPRYRLPTTSAHVSSWLQQRKEAAAKQEQQDFLTAFRKVDAAAMANKPIHGKATAEQMKALEDTLRGKGDGSIRPQQRRLSPTSPSAAVMRTLRSGRRQRLPSWQRPKSTMTRTVTRSSWTPGWPPSSARRAPPEPATSPPRLTDGHTGSPTHRTPTSAPRPVRAHSAIVGLTHAVLPAPWNRRGQSPRRCISKCKPASCGQQLVESQGP
jgi:hypothetical protein